MMGGKEHWWVLWLGLGSMLGAICFWCMLIRMPILWVLVIVIALSFRSGAGELVLCGV